MKLIKHIILFLIFGSIYYVIESVYKCKPTDWRMFVMAGCIGIIIGLINNLFSFETDFILQSLFGMTIALLGECICGYQWNVVEQLGIWDYHDLVFSYVDGQINIFFAIAWFVLSAVCIVIDDFLRWKLFNEEVPHYYVCGKEIKIKRSK